MDVSKTNEKDIHEFNESKPLQYQGVPVLTNPNGLAVMPFTNGFHSEILIAQKGKGV
jgi:hypothetical protein